ASGLVKLLDFGLARLATSAPLGPTVDFVTEVGRVMGTAGYMSPEQARGDVSDERGDIFSLGCVLYETATGRGAFPGDNAADVLAAVLRDQPTEMDASGTRVPVQLKQLVARCLAKKPDERFQSARELANALKSLTGVSPGQTPASASPQVTRPCVA